MNSTRRIESVEIEDSIIVLQWPRKHAFFFSFKLESSIKSTRQKQLFNCAVLMNNKKYLFTWWVIYRKRRWEPRTREHEVIILNFHRIVVGTFSIHNTHFQNTIQSIYEYVFMRKHHLPMFFTSDARWWWLRFSLHLFHLPSSGWHSLYIVYCSEYAYLYHIDIDRKQAHATNNFSIRSFWMV